MEMRREMSRIAGILARTVVAGAFLSATACADLLDVKNPNNPETDRVLASPADVEALIRDSYIQAKEPLLSADGINMQLGSVAFENSSTAANFGMIERSAFPRAAIINKTSNQFHPEYYEVWADEYAAIRSASDGLAKLAQPGFSLGTGPASAKRSAARGAISRKMISAAGSGRCGAAARGSGGGCVRRATATFMTELPRHGCCPVVSS